MTLDGMTYQNQSINKYPTIVVDCLVNSFKNIYSNAEKSFVQ